MSELGSILEYGADLSDIEAPSALPGSDYPAEIISAEVGISQSSQKPRVDVTFRIRPEDFPADYEDAESFPEGKDVHFYVGAGSDKASMFRMRQFCEKIGAPLSNRIDVNTWLGRKAMLSIEQDEYEGIKRERIRKVEAL